MNILIFSWRGPGHHNAGGAEQVTFAHAKAWVKARHQVTIFTSSFIGALPGEIIDGVKIIRRGSQELSVRREAFFWYLFKKQEDFDLIIDEFHGIPFFTPLYIKKPKLAFIHEVTKEVWGLNPWPKPLYFVPAIAGPIFEPLIFRLLYRSIPFMTVSNSTKQDLIKWDIPEKNITVIDNGVSVLEPNLKVKKERVQTITFLGALTKDKGIEDALEVFAKLNEIPEKYQFWIIGSAMPDYLQFLKQKAKKLKVLRQIKFWGFVDERKKFELLKRSHLLINPSIREGWGLVVIEAAAMGTPTVGYNVAGLRDSIKNNETGLLIKLHDVEGMSNNIEQLLNNQQRYDQMSKKAIAWSRSFSWSKSTAASLQLIESLV